MSTQHDSKSIRGLPKGVGEELVATFDALSNWRDEIETANERCLGKVLDRTAARRACFGLARPSRQIDTRILGRCREGADGNDRSDH
jgi:hypothetical protein